MHDSSIIARVKIKIYKKIDYDTPRKNVKSSYLGKKNLLSSFDKVGMDSRLRGIEACPGQAEKVHIKDRLHRDKTFSCVAVAM